jgi:hypothetical protein
MIGISLGYNCSSAINGVKLGLREEKKNGYKTCPFDECVTNYSGLMLCLKEDFKYFTDSKYLKIIETKEDMGGCKKGEPLLCNSRYNFIFNHESPGHANLYISQNWENGINHYIENDFFYFKKRYNNRINNFRNYINNNKINFLITKYNNNLLELDILLKKLYPNLDYKITFFETTESKSSILKHYNLFSMSIEEISKNFDMCYIIISINDNNYHTGFSALGHEIHLARWILLDMFNKGYILEKTTIVINNIDRKFLYSNLFNNIISYNDFLKMNIDDKNIIKLFPFSVSKNEDVEQNYIDNLKNKSNYKIENILYEKISLDINLIKNIDLIKIDNNLYKNDFIMIHHRYINKNLISNNNNSNNIIKTQKIIDFINNRYNYDIIIFSSDKNIKFNSNKENISYIYDLRKYCSLINNYKCLATISELSGGGEISQYFHNKFIYHYYNSYDEENIDIDLSKYDLKKNLHNEWNLHNCSNAKLRRSTLDNILNYLSNDVLI